MYVQTKVKTMDMDDLSEEDANWGEGYWPVLMVRIANVSIIHNIDSLFCVELGHTLIMYDVG